MNSSNERLKTIPSRNKVCVSISGCYRIRIGEYYSYFVCDAHNNILKGKYGYLGNKIKSMKDKK